MLTPRARYCADLILAAHHVDNDWAKAHEPQDAEDMREDAASGLAQALRYLAEASTPAAEFELNMLADEIDPVFSDASPAPAPSAEPA